MTSPSRRTLAAAADLAWQRSRRAALRWALWGTIAGALFGSVLFAPATWLAGAIHRATDGRLLLADALGSVWSGSAVAVLQGGAGSLDAAALPGRLHWRVGASWRGPQLALRQDCCLNGELRISMRPTLDGLRLELPARPEGVGQWPAQWLAGLGTPWNTLQLGGTLRLRSTGLTLQAARGRTRIDGGLTIELLGASSRVSPVDPLGSYRFDVRGNASADDAAMLTLETIDGALRLSGAGRWSGERLIFRGEARAAESYEAGLSNLLNIIGRRNGAASVISIG